MAFSFPSFRRLNPMVYLTICCALFILVIVAALIVFTFLPIFTKTKGSQTKYQGKCYEIIFANGSFDLVQSDVLLLTYNLPDRLSISPMNWTYVVDELDLDKLNILQNLVVRDLLVRNHYLCISFSV